MSIKTYRDITWKSEYWEERSLNRYVRAEMIGVQAMNKVLPLYEETLKVLTKEINDIYLKYSKDTGLDVSELTKILSGIDRNRFLVDIQKTMQDMGFNVKDIYNKSYIERLTRLEAMKQQVYWEIKAIAPKELAIQDGAYRKIIAESYRTSTIDIREQLGEYGTPFATIDKKVVDELLLERWSNGNYSIRTEKNISNFAFDLRDIVSSGLLSGISSEKMAREVRDRFEYGKYESMRLIRTETNYFQNQAELQSYMDEGIEYYRYMAMLDSRTSEMCEKLHDTIFRIDEAIVGENYPPLHPNCRSTTVVAFKNEGDKLAVTREKNSSSEDIFKEIYETQMKGLESQGFKRG